MFKRSEYAKRLADVGLTKEQTTKLRDVLEEMMTYASRMSNKAHANPFTDQADYVERYYSGKADGINAVDRFLRGDMDAHDEFEDESDG